MSESADLLTSLREASEQIAALVPRVLAGLLLAVAGWLLARLLQRATIRVLRWMRVDHLAERAGVEGFLLQGGVRYTTVTLLGGVVYWMVLFIVFVALLNVLGIPSAHLLIDRIVMFVPNVVVATVILVFGTMVARFVGALAYTYLSNIGSTAAEPIAALARYALLAFVAAMAAEQLALKSEILVSGFQIAFGALCLGLAIAFGLGGRKWAAQILEKYWKP